MNPKGDGFVYINTIFKLDFLTLAGRGKMSFSHKLLLKTKLL